MKVINTNANHLSLSVKKKQPKSHLKNEPKYAFLCSWNGLINCFSIKRTLNTTYKVHLLVS